MSLNLDLVREISILFQFCTSYFHCRTLIHDSDSARLRFQTLWLHSIIQMGLVSTDSDSDPFPIVYASVSKSESRIRVRQNGK